MKAKWVIIILIFLLLIAVSFLFKEKESIAVGIITSINSGTVVSSSEVNAAEFFIEENNIKSFLPRVVNDNWDPELTIEVTQGAINKGMNLFISSHPSKCAIASMHLFQDGKAFLINCASASPELSGRDDYIFRIISDAIEEQNAIADYIQHLEGKKLLVVQDDSNLAYTKPAFEYFSKRLLSHHKWTIVKQSFTISRFKPEDYKELFKQDFDALYILGGSFQSAIGNIAQYFYMFHPDDPVILTPWSRSPSILDISGPALKNIILTSSFPAKKENQTLSDYINRFQKRYNYAPHAMNFGVRQAMELYEQAIRKGHKTPEAIKQYLLSEPVHHTSLGNISFDKNGDVKQKYYFIRNVENELK
ncbi:MAG TPA: ABC transporter substrate-binding protein [Candidatus Cloacimonadota bacterium]|nr:ABC transporter substrate-binding protein [Candidatus Cloacimonadota bacterium]HPM01947.1 ABC transporter substrate-binding protein [Candidatus Cloacimonadota bacterium]